MNLQESLENAVTKFCDERDKIITELPPGEYIRNKAKIVANFMINNLAAKAKTSKNKSLQIDEIINPEIFSFLVDLHLCHLIDKRTLRKYAEAEADRNLAEINILKISERENVNSPVVAAYE